MPLHDSALQFYQSSAVEVSKITHRLFYIPLMFFTSTFNVTVPSCLPVVAVTHPPSLRTTDPVVGTMAETFRRALLGAPLIVTLLVGVVAAGGQGVIPNGVGCDGAAVAQALTL